MKSWPCTVVLAIYPCRPEDVGDTEPLWGTHAIFLCEFDPLKIPEEILEKIGIATAGHLAEFLRHGTAENLEDHLKEEKAQSE